MRKNRSILGLDKIQMLSPTPLEDSDSDSSSATVNEPDKTVAEFKGKPSSCVFVASLAATKSDTELSNSVTQHFEKWGTIAVKVLRDTANRPYAFVQFSNDRDAQAALIGAQHSVLDGRTIRCEPAKVNRTLYVATSSGGDTSATSVRAVVAEFGEIEEIIGNKKQEYNKAYFCKFTYRDDAIRAYANLRLDAKWVVEWAQNIEFPDHQATPLTIDRFSIFVGQLSPVVTKKDLVGRFKVYGAIKEATVIQKVSSTFAFVKFETEIAAAAAVERENHSTFFNETIHVKYREIRTKYRNKEPQEPCLSLAPPPVNFAKKNFKPGFGPKFSSAKWPYKQDRWSEKSYKSDSKMSPSSSQSKNSHTTVMTSYGDDELYKYYENSCYRYYPMNECYDNRYPPVSPMGYYYDGSMVPQAGNGYYPYFPLYPPRYYYPMPPAPPGSQEMMLGE